MTENLLLKILAFVFALVLWFFVTAEQTVEKAYPVPLELRNVPEGLVVTSEVPSLIDVRISGPRTVLLNLSPAELNIGVDLKGLSPGVTSFKRLEERLRLPHSLKITRLSPSVIDVRLERVQEKTVSVRPVFSGTLPEGLVVEKIEVSPREVIVSGAGSELKNVSDVETEPINVDEVRESFKLEVPLNYVGKNTSLEPDVKAVEVEVELGPARQERKKGK